MYRMKEIALWQIFTDRDFGKIPNSWAPLIISLEKTDDKQSYFLGTKGRSKQNPVYHEKVVTGDILLGSYANQNVWPEYHKDFYSISANLGGTIFCTFALNAEITKPSLYIGIWGAKYDAKTRREITVNQSYSQINVRWLYDQEAKFAIRDDVTWQKNWNYTSISPNFREEVRKFIISLPLFLYEDSVKRYLNSSYICGDLQHRMPRFHLALSHDIVNGDYRRGSRASVVLPMVPEVQFQNLFYEDLRYQGYPVIGLSNYWLELGMQHSFLDACQSAPVLNDNSLSNLLDLTSFIYNLVVKHQIDIPSSLSEAWLSYRYVYSTTKMDYEQAIDFMARNLPDNIWDIGFKVYGMYSFPYEDENITARCTMRLFRNEVSQIQDIWLALKKYGLAPDFYVIWDMIPYSFIVDWFIPVGDMLDVVDASTEYTEENYDFGEIVYSLKYSFIADDGLRHYVYSRWIEESPPALRGYYWFDEKSTSKKTLVKRILDTLAILH